MFVGWNNPRFRHTRDGYLPALCGDCPRYKEDINHNLKTRIERVEIRNQVVSAGKRDGYELSQLTREKQLPNATTTERWGVRID